MKNRILSMVIGLVMIIGLFPTAAMAGEMRDVRREPDSLSHSYREYDAPFNNYNHGMSFESYNKCDMNSNKNQNQRPYDNYKPYNMYNQKKVITNVAVTITDPVIGQTADYAPTVTTTPEGGVSNCKVTWVKIPKFRGFSAFFNPCGFGTMRTDETFKDGYYYLALISMSTYGTGYVASDFVSGTINGYPNVAIYGSIKQNDYNLFMCTVFEASEVEEEHIHSYEMKNDETNHWQECECGDVIDSEEHTFGEWTVTKESTFKKNGSQERVCTVCGFTETEEIPVIEHDHNFVYVVDENGHHQLCEECGDTTEVEEHTFGEWNITKEATYKETGLQEHECTLCGFVETEEIPIIAHEHNFAYVIDETTHYQVCDICGDTTEVEEHTFSDWTITKEATYKESGMQEHTCTACGFTESEEIPIIEHDHNFEYVTDETSHYQLCTICKDTTEAEGHSFGEWGITKEATRTEDGLQEKTCEICGYTVSEVIPAVPEEITSISAYITTPSYGQSFDFNPSFDVLPEYGVASYDVSWFKIPVDEYTGSSSDPMYEVSSDEIFTTGYYYVMKISMTMEDGFVVSDKITGSINGIGYASKQDNKNVVLIATFEPHIHEYSYGYDETNHWKQCDCGDIIETAEHIFGEWKTTRVANTYQEGIEERSCTECGYTETNVIPKVNIEHIHIFTTSYDETQHWKQCRCGEITDCEEHTFGDWTITKAATATSDGKQQRQCTGCRYKEIVVIPATGE